jgi:hypothetical protein
MMKKNKISMYLDVINEIPEDKSDVEATYVFAIVLLRMINTI